MAWRDDARAEVDDLKPHFVEKHDWAPRLVESDDAEALDLFVTLQSRKHPDNVFVLRLRYKPDWQTAGRREAFVDPDDPEREGIEYWPTDVSGLKPQNNPPCICLRGTWGYHSVLHTDHLMGDTTLLNLLVELQTVLDR
ncbi:MAG: hypothetical protein P1T08_14440 [Acidimicrobiia bacterium]|nr:hypothetical protein [Acidimicrobiia bacterium]